MISLKRVLCQRCDIMNSIGSVILILLTTFSVVVGLSMPNQNVTFVTYDRGANATLVCPATVGYVSVQWYYKPEKCTGRNGVIIPLPTNQTDSMYQTTNSPNGLSLSIIGIDLRDAGTYNCIIDLNNQSDESPEFTFHVTVIVSKPECHAEKNIVHENYTMKQLQCSITYCSLADPKIEWSQSGPDNEQIINIYGASNNKNHSTIGTTMTSFLTIIRTDQMPSWTYSCRTNFNHTRSEDNSFSSEKEFYNGICETSVMHVLSRTHDNDRLRMVTIIGGTAIVATIMVVALIVVILVYTKRRKRQEKLSHKDDYPARAASSHAVQSRGAQSDPIYSCIRETDELEYMEVNVSHDACSPTGPPSVQQQRFSTSVYAGIDHTLQLPR